MNIAVPRDGESQPDFAIRFHESAMSTIPSTSERNQKCFEVWREHVGDEPEVAEARRYHKSEEFLERRDIPVFEEHTIPARKSAVTGKTIPAVKYDRDALASICKNMNDAVTDVGKFCPITNGHTSDDRKDPEPEVLGYTGAYRLGMIGNKKPRYAIFADEYHRRDREEVLKGRRGRSVEVLPIPDVHKRSFYPIAALGADEPRLNLPPARYSKDGEPIEVERYQMVMPGGSGTFVPGQIGDRDKYGDDQEETPLDQKTIENVCKAIFQTAPFQFLIKQMEESGQSGANTPLVHQPPEMADMPADENTQLPGQNPAVPGQPQPDGLPPEAGSDMGAGSPASGMPPKQDAGGPMKPPFDKGNSPMADQEKDQYAKSSALQSVEARLQALEQENAGLKAKLIGAERYSKLNSLKSQGFEFDLNGELARVSSQTPEQFDAHCEVIEKYYRKSPTAVADFSEIAGIGRMADLPAGSNGVDELSADEAQEVVKYARANDIDNYNIARERYVANKKTAKATAG